MQHQEIENILKETGLSETELIFKSNVKRLRKSAAGSPTIKEMANALDLKYGTYRLIESFKPVTVKFEIMEKIAKYHNVSVSELFKL